jgi:DOPA 4,5-dioxygenase
VVTWQGRSKDGSHGEVRCNSRVHKSLPFDKQEEMVLEALLLMSLAIVIAVTLVYSLTLTRQEGSDLWKDTEPLLPKRETESDIPLEYHFHVYFYQTNKESTREALLLFNELTRLKESKDTFIGIPLNFNTEPVGPHPIGSYEVWCPIEYYARAYGWFLKSRGNLSVLIHPLTRHVREDHSSRAAWMGQSVPLDISSLAEFVQDIPLQYPEMGLGYSASEIY